MKSLLWAGNTMHFIGFILMKPHNNLEYCPNFQMLKLRLKVTMGLAQALSGYTWKVKFRQSDSGAHIYFTLKLVGPHLEMSSTA